MPPDIIASVRNAKIKHVIQLRTKKSSRSEGLTLVDGWREFERALEAGVHIQSVFYCPALLIRLKRKLDVRPLAAGGTDCHEVSETVYDKIAYGDRREGLVAVVRVSPIKLEAIRLGPRPLLVCVEGIEKPGNLGAIVRSCEAAGVDGLLACEYQGDLFNPNVVRASQGAVFQLPVTVCSNREALEFLCGHNLQLVAASPEAGRMYTDIDYTFPTAVVLGSEQAGLGRFWKDKATSLVRLPMKGKGDSLNVSVTAGIILYEALRQREQKAA